MVQWRITLLDGGECRDGTITTTRAMMSGRMHWRATFRERGSGVRVFGTKKTALVDTVSGLLDNIATRLARGERERIMGLVMQYGSQTGAQPTRTHPSQRPAGSGHQLRRRPSSANAPLECTGAQPTFPVAVPSADSSTNVKWVHQIYGCFRDNKPMNARFVESRRRWEAVAASMGACYHLWNADEVDTLVRTTCGFLWGTYENCRYPVMRADIGRVAILYSYGGLYSDLDVFPNRSSYRQVPFAVCMRPNRSNKAGAQPTFLDMEVLVANINHPLLWGWLEYMQHEITRFPYETGFWRMAKMRYVWQTTGPLAMQRFLRRPANNMWATSISYVQCSTAEEGDTDTAGVLQKYECVSVTSNTYFTDEHKIEVGVVAHDVSLPERNAPRRRFRKLPPDAYQAPSQLPRRCEGASEDVTATRLRAEAATARADADAAIAACRREMEDEKAAMEKAASAQIAAASEEAAAARRERDLAAEEAAAARQERDAAVQKAADACRERANLWEQYVAADSRADTWAAVALYLKDSAAGQAFIQMCPAELREEVHNPTEAVKNQAYAFHCSPPDYVRPLQPPNAGAQPTTPTSKNS